MLGARGIAGMHRKDMDDDELYDYGDDYDDEYGSQSQ